MSNPTETVSEIRSWWSGEGQDLVDEISKVQADIKTQRACVDAIKNKKSEGSVLKFLSNAWDRATLLPTLNNEIRDLENLSSCLNLELTDQATEHGDLLLAAIASGHELVWLSYTSILSGLKELSGDQYDTAMTRYIDLRLYVARNTALPEIFYDYLPQNLQDESVNPSAEWRFDMRN